MVPEKGHWIVSEAAEHGIQHVDAAGYAEFLEEAA